MPTDIYAAIGINQNWAHIPLFWHTDRDYLVNWLADWSKSQKSGYWKEFYLSSLSRASVI